MYLSQSLRFVLRLTARPHPSNHNLNRDQGSTEPLIHLIHSVLAHARSRVQDVSLAPLARLPVRRSLVVVIAFGGRGACFGLEPLDLVDPWLAGRLVDLLEMLVHTRRREEVAADEVDEAGDAGAGDP
jgi:hypothetical protein